MNLAEFIPEKPIFHLSSTGQDYELRIPNLEDRVEMLRIAGSQEDVVKIFKNQDWPQICRLVYRLLKDRSQFQATKIKMFDDDGFEIERTITGPIKLLQAVQTQAESISLMTALSSAIAAGEPLVKEYIANEQKKNDLREKLITEKSSMSSQANMDTLQNSLGNLLSENSA